MRIVVDEDIPKELTPLFRGPGLKGKKNGVLLAALSGSYDVLDTGDANLGHQQNLRKFDLAIMLIHPQRLVVEQIKPLIPLAVAAPSPTTYPSLSALARSRLAAAGPRPVTRW
jgi:hypothetical protein